MRQDSMAQAATTILQSVQCPACGAWLLVGMRVTDWDTVDGILTGRLVDHEITCQCGGVVRIVGKEDAERGNGE